MKKPLLLALATVLSTALYLNAQDEADIEPTGGSVKRAHRSGSTPTVSGPPASVARAPSVAGAAPGHAAAAWQERAMRTAMTRWIERAEDAPTEAAWASAWGAPAPEPVRAEAPPVEAEPPQAEVAPPPFPHVWVGRIEDEGAPSAPEPSTTGASGVRRLPTRAVISSADRTWLVREGEMLDEHWRLDAIHGRSLQLTYLPLNKTLTVLKP